MIKAAPANTAARNSGGLKGILTWYIGEYFPRTANTLLPPVGWHSACLECSNWTDTCDLLQTEPPKHVNRVVFSPDGKTVVTSGADGTARIWDPLSGKELMVFKGHTDEVTGVAF